MVVVEVGWGDSYDVIIAGWCLQPCERGTPLCSISPNPSTRHPIFNPTLPLAVKWRRLQLLTGRRPRPAHNSSSPPNMVRDGHVVAILDWEYAGWLPEVWEYVFALRGMDLVDWNSLGSQVTGLFGTRYDLEYILMNFIISIC